MTRTMSITEAQKHLRALPKRFEKDPELEAVTITEKGKPVLAVMSWKAYESVASIIETAEIMADREMMAAICRSEQEIKEGRTYSMEEVKRELAL